MAKDERLPPGPRPDRLSAIPDQERPSVKLLVEYEEFIGEPLRKLEKPRILEETKAEWPWSWSPEQVTAFLSEWDRPLYVMNDLLRDLAFTSAPDGRSLMFERACKPEVRGQIDRIVEINELPIGTVPPVPEGTSTADLTQTPMFYVGPGSPIFKINSWVFSGRVRNISYSLAQQLIEIHGRWLNEWQRMFIPHDHGTQDLGVERRGI